MRSKKRKSFITSNPITCFHRLQKLRVSLSKPGWLCSIKTCWHTSFMLVISSRSHRGPFGLQMGHLEDAFTLCLTVILWGPQAVCVNMIRACVCAHACYDTERRANPRHACIWQRTHRPGTDMFRSPLAIFCTTATGFKERTTHNKLQQITTLTSRALSGMVACTHVRRHTHALCFFFFFSSVCVA